ncbi:MAG TPA: hypothetical protein VNA69_06155 [Thermoanaerobaculia bacterium]|nr:hypothetical protein [Thermoanaerobaculia bacterium]
MSSMTRDEAINRLRDELVRMTDDEHCMCSVAAAKRIFCNGFAQFSDDELRRRYWWIVRRRPSITREQLEQIANDWQLAQQEVKDMPIACDVQRRLHDTCRGWNDFSNEQLAKFYEQFVGEPVEVV